MVTVLRQLPHFCITKRSISESELRFYSGGSMPGAATLFAGQVTRRRAVGNFGTCSDKSWISGCGEIYVSSVTDKRRWRASKPTSRHRPACVGKVVQCETLTWYYVPPPELIGCRLIAIRKPTPDDRMGVCRTNDVHWVAQQIWCNSRLIGGEINEHPARPPCMIHEPSSCGCRKATVIDCTPPARVLTDLTNACS